LKPDSWTPKLTKRNFPRKFETVRGILKRDHWLFWNSKVDRQTKFSKRLPTLKPDSWISKLNETLKIETVRKFEVGRLEFWKLTNREQANSQELNRIEAGLLKF
jgi:hypothetical protein